MPYNVMSGAGARAVAIARGWIGTPYHHQASARGIGTDCLGLIRGIWRELYGSDAEMPPAYSRDWAEASGMETMLDAASRHLCPVPLESAQAGDVVIFRMSNGAVAKHAGLLTGPDMMIHAMEGVCVCEVPLSRWWRRRMTAAFRFPGV